MANTCTTDPRCTCEACRVARVASAIHYTDGKTLGSIDELHRDFLAILGDLKEAREQRERLRAELGEHYPISITARALLNEEATLPDLRDVADMIGRSTPGARVAMLPPRLQGPR